MSSTATPPPPGGPPVTPRTSTNLPAEDCEALAQEGDQGEEEEKNEQPGRSPRPSPSRPLPITESRPAVALEIAPASETASTVARDSSPEEPRIKLLYWLLVGGTGQPPTRAAFWRMAKQRNDAGRRAKHKVKRNKKDIGSHSNATDDIGRQDLDNAGTTSHSIRPT